jgi:hypothetical protein
MPTLPLFQVQPGDAEHNVAVRGVCEMPVQTRLKQIVRPFADDMVIGPPPKLPLFEGLDDESLVCPGCSREVTTGVSALTLQALFRAPGRLLFHCECDAYGEVDRCQSAGSLNNRP